MFLNLAFSTSKWFLEVFFLRCNLAQCKVYNSIEPYKLSSIETGH